MVGFRGPIRGHTNGETRGHTKGDTKLPTMGEGWEVNMAQGGGMILDMVQGGGAGVGDGMILLSMATAGGSL